MNKDRLTTLEEKVDLIVQTLERCLGLALNDDQSGELVQLKEKSFPIHLSEHIQNVESFQVALETLNQYGNSRGVSFKIGCQRQLKGQPPYEKSIICKYKNRNKEKNCEISKENTSKVLIKTIDCPVKYKFKAENDKITFMTCDEDHNQAPFLGTVNKLSSPMLEDISKYNKNSKITEIRDTLEMIYNVKLDYMSVYYQFRKYFPRFGNEDCRNFLKYLERNEASFRYTIAEGESSLCKLIFSTKLMQENYEKYGDILLIDTTYNTNFYSAPLVVLSGVGKDYKNILFALAIINDEKAETYVYLLEKFKEITPKNPILVVSDQDAALTSAIETVFNNVPHRFCNWHVARSLRRQFGFINNQYEELKTRVFGLPYMYSIKKFNNLVTEFEKFLEDQKLEKSLAYFKKLLTKKQQWARAYYPRIFDADISTTSRVEAWNVCLKTYLNSTSELSDFIHVIENIEKNCYFSSPIQSKSEIFALLEFDSLLRDLKKILSPRIYEKEVIQYSLGRRDYDRTLIASNEESVVYKVFFADKSTDFDLFYNDIDINTEKPVYEVICSDKITCSCDFYDKTGLVCRHIFFICNCENIREVSRLKISQRWINLDESNKMHFSHQLELLISAPKAVSAIDQNKEILEVVKEENESIEIVEVTSKVEDLTNMKKVVSKKGAPKKGNK